MIDKKSTKVSKLDPDLEDFSDNNFDGEISGSDHDDNLRNFN